MRITSSSSSPPMKHRRKNHNQDFFEDCPDDVVILILTKLSSTASSPSHFFNTLLTCKRLNRLGFRPVVLSKAGPKVLAVKPKNWCENSHHFLKRCVNVGNVDAFYTLGMIQFYCLRNPRSGLALIAKAAMKLHAPALYSLAVIQFNGSGGTTQDKDLRAGVALSARASLLGHIDALRQLAHCLQDGYGVKQNITEGQRLLVQANMREFLLVVRFLELASPSRAGSCEGILSSLMPLINANRYNVPVVEPHPVNRFLREWFESGLGMLEDGLRLCAHIGCGRAETRSHEFQLCPVCRKVSYCSRVCQTLDWKLGHKIKCSPMDGGW